MLFAQFRKISLAFLVRHCCNYKLWREPGQSWRVDTRPLPLIYNLRACHHIRGSVSSYQRCIVISEVYRHIRGVSSYQRCIIISEVYRHIRGVSSYQRCIIISKVYRHIRGVSSYQRCIVISNHILKRCTIIIKEMQHRFVLFAAPYLLGLNNIIYCGFRMSTFNSYDNFGSYHIHSYY